KYGPLTITVQTRLQNEIALLKVDPKTGQTSLLIAETDPTWVNLHQDTPRWLADGKSFLWTSEGKDGPQLELRDGEGLLLKVLVPASWGYPHLLAADASTGKLAYQAARFNVRRGKVPPFRDPTQLHVDRLSNVSDKLPVHWSASEEGGLQSASFNK